MTIPPNRAIIIPMVSRSSSFSLGAFNKPRFMLPAFNKSIFYFSVNAFRQYFETNDFVFLLPDDPEFYGFVQREVNALGITKPRLVRLDRAPVGEAEAVMLWLEEGDLKDRGKISVANARSRAQENLKTVSYGASEFCSSPEDYIDFLLSGLVDAWDGDAIGEVVVSTDVSLHSFWVEKEKGNHAEARSILREVVGRHPLSVHHLLAVATYLHELKRGAESDAVFAIAHHYLQDDLENSIKFVITAQSTNRFDLSLDVCNEITASHGPNSRTLFYGVCALSSLGRRNEASQFIASHMFFDLPEKQLLELSYFLSDAGFIKKSRRILHANWVQRPGPDILHSRLKLVARSGHARERLRLALDAIDQGVDLLKIDRLHAVAIARRLKMKKATERLCFGEVVEEKPLAMPSVLGETPRVALCLSGQMRGFEQNAPSITKYIIDRYKADVFVSTWSNRGVHRDDKRDYFRILPHEIARIAQSYWSRTVFAKKFPVFLQLIDGVHADPISSELVLKHFNAISVSIAHEEEFEKKYFTPRAIKILRNRTVLKNQTKMYYQLDRCNQLKLDHEIKNNLKYDVVIRIRPDLVVVDGMLPEIEYFGLDVYCDRVFSRGCGDQLCFSSSDNMDLMCSVWERAQKVIEGDVSASFDPNRLGIDSHAFFAETMWGHGLAPRENKFPSAASLNRCVIFLPDAVRAMLQDMAMWPSLESEDIGFINTLMDNIEKNWPDYLASIQQHLKKVFSDKVIEKLSTKI